MKKYVYGIASALLFIIGISLFFGATHLESDDEQIIMLKSKDGKELGVSVEVANRFQELRDRIQKLLLIKKKKKIEFALPFNASTIEAVINFSGIPLEPIGVGLPRVIEITDRADIDSISALVGKAEVVKRVQSIVNCAEFLVAPRRVYTWLGRILTYDKIPLPRRFWRHVNAETIKNDVARITYLLEGSVNKRLRDNRALGFSVEGLIKYKRLKISIATQEDRRILELKKNFIRRLDGLKLLKFNSDGALEKAQDFAFLDLSKNRLSHIKQGDFEGFKLRGLDLSQNMLADIPKKSAADLATLEVLNLASNHIEKLPLGLFSYSKGLSQIRLSGNYISELNQKSFVGLSNVEHLDVGHNKIKKIEPRTFESVRHVDELFLDNNKLTDEGFNTAALTKFNTLTLLALEGNQFSSERKQRIKRTLEISYRDIKITL